MANYIIYLKPYNFLQNGQTTRWWSWCMMIYWMISKLDSDDTGVDSDFLIQNNKESESNDNDNPRILDVCK